MTDPTETNLLEAIQADPFDESARQVYADWLDERGDPRGEYLRLVDAMERAAPRLAELAAIIDPAWITLLTRHYKLVISGRATSKILAIKLVREVTGLGLAAALAVVDGASERDQVIATKLDRESALRMLRSFEGVIPVRCLPGMTDRTPAPRPLSARPYRAVLIAIAAARRPDAIRLVRERTGLSLAECRDRIDAVARGAAITLRSELDGATAAELATAFAGVAEVRIEHASAGDPLSLLR